MAEIDLEFVAAKLTESVIKKFKLADDAYKASIYVGDLFENIKSQLDKNGSTPSQNFLDLACSVIEKEEIHFDSSSSFLYETIALIYKNVSRNKGK